MSIIRGILDREPAEIYESHSPKKPFDIKQEEEERTNSSTPRRKLYDVQPQKAKNKLKEKGYYPMSKSKIILICIIGIILSFLSEVDTFQDKDVFRAISLRQEMYGMAQFTVLNVSNTYHEKYLKKSFLPEPIRSLWGYLELGTINFTITTTTKLGIDFARQKWYMEEGSNIKRYDPSVLEVIVFIESSQSPFSGLGENSISIADYKEIEKGIQDKYRKLQMDKNYASTFNGFKWHELNRFVLTKMNGGRQSWTSNMLGAIKADFKVKVNEAVRKMFPQII